MKDSATPTGSSTSLGERVPSVGDDIHQAAFRSRSQEATLALLRTADDARRLASSAMATGGVTLQQYNVLRILRGAGDEGLPTLSADGLRLDVAEERIGEATRAAERRGARERIQKGLNI